MSDTDTHLKAPDSPPSDLAVGAEIAATPDTVRPKWHFISVVVTPAAVALAAVLSWAMWGAYMEAPWTRDATVRTYVVTIAPEVSGRIAELAVVDNQFVHKGQVLMMIDPTDYRIAVKLAIAAVQQAQASALNADREATRRQRLSDAAAISVEQTQAYQTQAIAARAQLQQAQANLEQARVNLARTTIRSPVSGWVTNLLAQLGDYASTGQSQISIVDAGSFWIDGYFAETQLGSIHKGDRASVKLMGYSTVLPGRVVSIARGIDVANAQPSQGGLAQVNPIFSWVRLAQRIPVRVHIDNVPEGMVLAAGMTATVQIELPRGRTAR